MEYKNLISFLLLASTTAYAGVGGYINSIINVTETVKKEAITLRPELIPVCSCESRQGQFEEDGRVVTSHTGDFGLCQINEIHLEEAKKLGMDIMTEEGNILFANKLFSERGYQPWEASRHCWDK